MGRLVTLSEGGICKQRHDRQRGSHCRAAPSVRLAYALHLLPDRRFPVSLIERNNPQNMRETTSLVLIHVVRAPRDRLQLIQQLRVAIQVLQIIHYGGLS